MSGLLDEAILGAEYPRRALDNVRDLLRSDEAADLLWDAVDDVVSDEIETGTVSRQAIVRAVLAALAGDDQ